MLDLCYNHVRPMLVTHLSNITCYKKPQNVSKRHNMTNLRWHVWTYLGSKRLIFANQPGNQHFLSRERSKHHHILKFTNLNLSAIKEDDFPYIHHHLWWGRSEVVTIHPNLSSRSNTSSHSASNWHHLRSSVRAMRDMVIMAGWKIL